MKKVKITDKSGIVLQTANKHLDDDVFVTVDESIMGGGGVEINGLIEEYKVLAGENISAGDFVEILNNRYKLLDKTTYSSYKSPSCVLLDSNRVFIAHSSGTNLYLYGTIVTIDGTTMTATTTQLDSTAKSCSQSPKCVLLEPNKVFIAHSYGSSNYLYGTIVTINGTTQTAVSKNMSSHSCPLRPDCILLEPNKVFVAYPNGNSEYYLYGLIVNIDGTNISYYHTQLSTKTYSCYYSPSCVLLDSNRVFIAHSSEKVDTIYETGYRLYGTIVTINGTTQTATTFVIHGLMYSCFRKPDCILLEPNKIFIAHSYSNNLKLYGTVLTLNGDNMVTRKSMVLNNDNQSCYQGVDCTLIDNNKVFVAHSYSSSSKLYGTVVEVDGDTMTAHSQEINGNSNACGDDPECMLLDSSNIFITHKNSSYLYGSIYFGGFNIRQSKGIISGVAKTSGTGGDTIQVYVPNNS